MEAAIAAFSSLFNSRPDQESSNTYKYQPLHVSDSIRLVCLTTTDGKVHGTLKEVRLSEKPDYRALSYVWGEAFDGANGEEGAGATRPFVLDGRVIQVTANLADFLDVVVKVHVQHGHQLPVTFWIDALCINQADDEVKTVQVVMMRQIYDQYLA